MRCGHDPIPFQQVPDWTQACMAISVCSESLSGFVVLEHTLSQDFGSNLKSHGIKLHPPTLVCALEASCIDPMIYG